MQQDKRKNRKRVAPVAQKYTYRVEWSEEDGVYVARVLEFPSVAAHGPDSLKAHLELLKVVDAILEEMVDNNEQIPEPLGLQKFGGKIPLRVTPEMHKQLKIEAAEQEVSLNQYLVSKLAPHR